MYKIIFSSSSNRKYSFAHSFPGGWGICRISSKRDFEILLCDPYQIHHALSPSVYVALYTVVLSTQRKHNVFCFKVRMCLEEKFVFFFFCNSLQSGTKKGTVSLLHLQFYPFQEWRLVLTLQELEIKVRSFPSPQAPVHCAHDCLC